MKSDDIIANNIPCHVGLILDGNRRWAKENGFSSGLNGHKAGYDNLKNIADYAFNKGVRNVSAYVFSTENWNRSKEEVDYLMKLLLRMMKRDIKELHRKGVKVLWLGTKVGLKPDIIQAIEDAILKTEKNIKGTLAFCLNYGGHQEIVDATSKIISKGYKAEDITPELIEDNLYSPELGPVDLMIRTSGEQRLSGFNLWRCSYSELVFTDKKWPAFTNEDLDIALEEFARRNRRFGGDAQPG
ncbi:MAG: undecaprenyl diphosphate synthase [Patescibacteria group bacterium]|nr:undecaprenyl diphosphate synthase [Patescibacteria group bacterium]